MNVHSFYFQASLFGDIKKIGFGLLEEAFVGYFFWVVVPVPHFYSVACGVSDYGFSFEGRVVA